MSYELVKADAEVEKLGLMKIGEIFAASGFFKDSTDPAKALVKVLAGRELGFGAFASMAGIHVIEGKPEVSANLQAIAIKRSGRYDYKVLEKTESVCRIEFFAVVQGQRESLGVETFTIDDAKRAGLAGKQNWARYPKNMLFARALSNGAATHCPDALGMRVYGEGEIEERDFGDHEPEKKPVKTMKAAEAIAVVQKAESVMVPGMKPAAPLATALGVPADHALGGESDDPVEKKRAWLVARAAELPTPERAKKFLSLVSKCQGLAALERLEQQLVETLKTPAEGASPAATVAVPPAGVTASASATVPIAAPVATTPIPQAFAATGALTVAEVLARIGEFETVHAEAAVKIFAEASKESSHVPATIARLLARHGHGIKAIDHAWESAGGNYQKVRGGSDDYCDMSGRGFTQFWSEVRALPMPAAEKDEDVVGSAVAKLAGGDF